MREEDEEQKLTVPQAAVLTGVSEATLRDRLAELAAKSNGGPQAVAQGAELEAVPRSEIAERAESHQSGEGNHLALSLVGRLEAQASEITRLAALASKAESLARELAAERQDRAELEGELEEARSELQSLRSHIGGLEARHHHRLGLETELVRTQAELAATKAQLAEAQTTWWRDVLSSRLPFRRAERERPNEGDKRRREALEAELVDVRGALGNAHRRIAELEERENERAALQEQLATAQRELQDARERIRESSSGRSSWGLSLVGNILGRRR